MYSRHLTVVNSDHIYTKKTQVWKNATPSGFFKGENPPSTYKMQSYSLELVSHPGVLMLILKKTL